ncbi:MAG: NAD(P)H-hydrate dehydratase, partial [Chitinophagaceae bacterium]
MKIFSAAQTRDWDAYSIAQASIRSIDLMERAAGACTRWLLARYGTDSPFHLFCGKGNNGGDGLAIARLLHAQGRRVAVSVLENGKDGSFDFEENRRRLAQAGVPVQAVGPDQAWPLLSGETVVVDALFGTGLKGPLQGAAADVVRFLNGLGRAIVSIDLPSGLDADASSAGWPVVRAAHTLTFGAPKTGQLLQEAGDFVGILHVLDIGLSPAFAAQTPADYEYVDEALARSRFRPRQPFAHKGTYGHALLLAGGYGKMGAAVMAALACLRGGAGLLTCHSPRCGYSMLQTTVPEAMYLPDDSEEQLTTLPADLDRYTAIGIGPGIGTSTETTGMLKACLDVARQPLVLDADALNILARNPGLLPLLPEESILTPHPKEFDRLFGTHGSDFDRITTARAQAAKLNCVVLLKGHHTFIATPAGPGYFNSTGNAGMAKGGSGDVLTGLLTALLAQGYAPADAALLGVWLHG